VTASLVVMTLQYRIVNQATYGVRIFIKIETAVIVAYLDDFLNFFAVPVMKKEALGRRIMHT